MSKDGSVGNDGSVTEATAAEPTSPQKPRKKKPNPVVATLKWGWGQLTSMKTALLLLFLLALASIPGGILPQRPTVPFQVEDYLDQHPRIGPVLDAIGMFDVYNSAWFSAVYLLLFVSLLGCIIPRVRVYARALRRQPPRTPRKLGGLPTSATGTVDADTDTVLDRAEEWLKSRRYRVRREADSVSAERGYLREAGNLVFHISLVGVLLGVGINSLWSFKGEAVVVEGQGFSNSLVQYDSFTRGAMVDPEQMAPFHLGLDAFEVEFETGPVQRGAARLFRAHAVVTEPGRDPQDRMLEVNKPLQIGGSTVHLIQHGYAPVVEVRDGNGDIAYAGPVVFLPQDGNFSSAGIINAPDGRPERLAFEGFFLPTADIDNELGPVSLFPDAYNPELFLNAWSGPPKAEETGIPQNVYVLDTSGLEPVRNADGTDTLRMRLKPGEQMVLPDGQGSIAFVGFNRWIKVQVSSSPGLWVIVGFTILGVIGVSASLFVRPRRMFLRLTGDEVAVAGLDRVDGRTGLREELDAFADAVGLSENEPDEVGEETAADPGEEDT